MGKNDDTIRAMTADEIGLAVDWAAAEGWNPGLNDGACYHAADNGGFLAKVLAGEIIAVISAIRYGAAFGFLGFYIVRPDYRGRGHGLRIWNAALERLRGCNIGLDGVVAQQDAYRKSGFTLAHRNIRFASTGGDGATAPGIVALAGRDFATVERYSRPYFPAPRPAFLRAWMVQPGAHALGLVQDGTLTGYGVLRPCRAGSKIGPLFADTAHAAEALFAALAAKAAPGTPVFLDVPETNPAAVALAERHGMTRVFETARMYTGPAPDIAIGRTFGITSFEIG